MWPGTRANREAKQRDTERRLSDTARQAETRRHPGRKAVGRHRKIISGKIIVGVRHEAETPVDQGPRDIAHLGELASRAQNPRFDAQHHIKTDVPHL